MLDFLKELPNLGLYFVVWSVLCFWLNYKRNKLYIFVISIGITLFLVSSTNYVPKRLIAGIEKNHDPIILDHFDRSKTYYIHVLGSGASNDAKLPASMNLGDATLSRLVEGIRIYRSLEHKVLVTSAGNNKGFKSQAEISKEAAISLGVKEDDIEMLTTPTTTLEEAIAFKTEFGTDKNIILITSALHMPRALEIFKDQGLNAIPAPSSYLYKEDGRRKNGITIPSIESLVLMNSYHITQLKHMYYRMFNKRKKDRQN